MVLKEHEKKKTETKQQREKGTLGKQKKKTTEKLFETN